MDIDALIAKEPNLIKMLWEHGDLTYKLKKCQDEMLRDITNSNRFKYVIKCSRRLGKSFLLIAMANMKCLSQKNAQVRFVAPTGKALRKIVHPIMKKIIEDCPNNLQPEWRAMDSLYIYPNGSELHLAGVNNGHADDARGTAADLILVDEAGTVDDLHYVVHDVLMPQLLDPNGMVVKGRRLILASSPPRTPAHEFTEMAKVAEMEGNYSHYDIFDGEYPLEVIRMFLKEDGVTDSDIDALLSGNYDAIKSTTVKREYLALDVVDTDSALVPEWNDKYIQTIERDEFYQYYQKYDALDIGVRDLSVNLFAYYDFQRSALVIKDEFALNGPEMTTEKIAERTRLKESEHFDVKWECLTENNKTRWKMIAPNNYFKIRRISDIDLLLIQDLSLLHGLYFEPTDKGTLEQMINQVRIWVGQGKIIVDPKCEQLIGCLRYGVWNDARTQFDRSIKYGHYDALASVMYLVRNCDTKTNPIPIYHNKSVADTWFTEKPKRSKDALKRAFNLK